MNKYELALVVNAKVEDDERAATVEKVKGLIDAFRRYHHQRGRLGQEETCLRDPEDERGLLLLHPV